MNAFSNPAQTYQKMGTYSSVAYADSHSLITQMLDGAMKKIAQAKGAIQRKEISGKVEAISHAVTIIGSLEACLDHKKGGEISQNLSDLYEYMNLTLMEANATSDIKKLDEVIGLIQPIRSAWVQIKP